VLSSAPRLVAAYHERLAGGHHRHLAGRSAGLVFVALGCVWRCSWRYACMRHSRRSIACHPMPPDVESRLEALARATGRTKTFYAREAILQHLEDLEDLYLAEQRLADIRAGKTRAVPLDEVMKQHGMED
jgi:RHH-type rel operon transcriptional repressor/antitoxin RelB